MARADGHRRAAAGLRPGAAALQARGQGPRHARRPSRVALSAPRHVEPDAERATLRDCGRCLQTRAGQPGRCDDAEQLWRQGARSRSASASYEIFRLDALQQRFDVARLPFSLKILLENLLRTEGTARSTPPTSRRSPAGTPRPQPSKEIAFTPARVLMQDFTGVPAVVDLAAMRDAMAAAGRRPGEDQPARAGRARDRPLGAGRRLRHARRVPRQRRARVRAQPGALRVPALGPGRVRRLRGRPARHRASSTRSTSSTSRASCSRTRRPASAYPDTLVGTDSHTTMVNGLGVLGWGVGGIEAEAAMLGQPMSMLIPQVRRLPAARRAARGRDRDRPRADRHRDAARARRRRQVRRVLRRRASPACRSPTARRSATCRRSTARRARSSRSTTRRCATSSSPAARRAGRAGRGVREGAGPLARRERRGADVLRRRSSSTWRPSSRASPGRSARRTASR